MRHLFLIDESILYLDFQDFKKGLIELNAIERYSGDQFNKGPNVIHSTNYANLYQNWSQANQVLAKFIEQLSTCEENIQTEEDAKVYCNSEINGFFGSDFSQLNHPEDKTIVDQSTYDIWSFRYSTKLNQLAQVLGPYSLISTFEKEYLDLSIECQDAIVNLFNRAKNRGLKTDFYPDTKIISDVTQGNFIHHVRELRVYAPVALRVYFHESNDQIILAGISLKSAPNQNLEIKKMYDRIKEFLK